MTRKNTKVVVWSQESTKEREQNVKVVFGSYNVLRKEKNTKKNDFLVFGCLMKNLNGNQI